MTGCSSELTLGGFSKVDVIGKYFGTYVSSLDLEVNDFPWWQLGEYAIWKSNDSWNIGLLTNLGSDEAEIVSINNTLCPHSTDLLPNQIVWAYRETDGSLTDPGPYGITTTFGKYVIFLCFDFSSAK